jgi:hypothetical protein
MPIVTSSADAIAARKPVEVQGRTYYLAPYVGAVPLRGQYVEGNEDNDNGEPQGFLVDQPANATTPAHFHEPDQFQVFVGGSADFGKQAARPLSVHFAAGHTPYGPIVAGDEGILYFTLRAQWDPGAKYMPGSRDKLIKGRQRHNMAANIDLLEGTDLADAGPVAEQRLIELEEDGMGASLFTFGANESADIDLTASGAGQYAIIVGGSAVHEGGELPWLSGYFRRPEEGPLAIEAGADGAAVLLMQFPSRSPAHA